MKKPRCTERGILMKCHLVRKTLANQKTETRRIVKGINAGEDFDLSDFPSNPLDSVTCVNGVALFECQTKVDDTSPFEIKCPYGRPGDLLYVKETWQQSFDVKLGPRQWEYRPQLKPKPGLGRLLYKADTEGPQPSPSPKLKLPAWRSPIHMPKWASRLWLEILDIQVGQVQEITAEAITAEGIDDGCGNRCGQIARQNFELTWDAINGKGSFACNPWVWVIKFKRIERKANQCTKANANTTTAASIT